MTFRLPTLCASVRGVRPEEADHALLIVGAFTSEKKVALTPSAADVDVALQGTITRQFERGSFTAALGTSLLLPESDAFPGGVAVMGLGEMEDFDAEAFKTLLEKAASTFGSWAQELAFTADEWLPGDMEEKTAARLFAATLLNGLNERVTLKTTDTPLMKTERILWVNDEIADDVATGLEEGRQCAEAMVTMRYLADLPGNVCTPVFLADFVTEAAKEIEGLTVEVYDEKAIADFGMGAFLSVSQGSVVPPRFIVMRWQGGEKDAAPIALVGKGITFDAGGICLKPRADMADMIYDMSGAASVIGTVLAAARAGLKKNVLGVVAACENLPSGSAAKPGDVVASLAGKTIEILNTDCEGRMVLADALCWTAKERPAVMLDMATLTGSVCVALGTPYSGLFTTDTDLADELVALGHETLDEVWPMPVGPAYKKLMRSNVADIANQATTRNGGASSAAAFLSVFAGDVRWAHLDIAATANVSGRDRRSTGRPASLLTAFLLEHSVL